MVCKMPISEQDCKKMHSLFFIIIKRLGCIRELPFTVFLFTSYAVIGYAVDCNCYSTKGN